MVLTPMVDLVLTMAGVRKAAAQWGLLLHGPSKGGNLDVSEYLCESTDDIMSV